MTIRPHDVTDLYLAPVALDLDTELGSLAGKSEHALLVYVALHTDREPSTIEERRTPAPRRFRPRLRRRTTAGSPGTRAGCGSATTSTASCSACSERCAGSSSSEPPERGRPHSWASASSRRMTSVFASV